MVFSGSQPAIALVDDDFHSARLMTRTLEAHGAPSISHITVPDRALDALSGEDTTCSLAIVDLKGSSTATRDFVRELKDRAPDLVVVAMSPTLEREVRDTLLDAGAAAVFERHADISRYRSEAASIVDFWARQQRLERTGT